MKKKHNGREEVELITVLVGAQRIKKTTTLTEQTRQAMETQRAPSAQMIIIMIKYTRRIHSAHTDMDVTRLHRTENERTREEHCAISIVSVMVFKHEISIFICWKIAGKNATLLQLFMFFLLPLLLLLLLCGGDGGGHDDDDANGAALYLF